MKFKIFELFVTLKKQFIYIILFALCGILVFLFLSLADEKNSVVNSLLQERMDQTQSKLENFFGSVEDVINIIQERGKYEGYTSSSSDTLTRIKDLKNLNVHFFPVLSTYKAVSAIDLCDDLGNEYLLIHRDSLWINRLSYEGGRNKKSDRFEWSLSNEMLVLRSRSQIEKQFDPRVRPWYVGILDVEDQAVFWTKPYTFTITNEPGITVSKKWHDSQGNIRVIALDVSILDISRFTTRLEISPRGKAFVTSPDGRLLGLPKDPRFSSLEGMKSNVLKRIDELELPLITAASDEGKRQSQRTDCFDFRFKGEKWWAMVKQFQLGKNTFYIAVIAPESDFLEQFQQPRWLILGGVLMLVFLTVIIIMAYQDKEKSNNFLEVQKRKIEEKNKEIFDSIVYAEHLQEAILPSKKVIKQCFPDSFILYKPKDIVAGDFYWMKPFAERIFFAAADCTGHGVPGAMISVVCANALNQTILEYGIVEPGQILDKVTDHVIETFGHGDEEVNDGMDIALCCIDAKEKKVWYAGANNPLYRITKMNEEDETKENAMANGNVILMEYKATRQPVGKFPKRKPFETEEIHLKEGDCLYIFSDGFSDQFGGAKGKKYKSKPFKKFLLSIHDKTMEEQYLLLDKEFEYWKGNQEQVDDVCVWGIRV